MKTNNGYKAILVNAFISGRITKEELKFLHQKGITFPPIPWIDGPEDEIKKRDILERALEIKFFRVKRA